MDRVDEFDPMRRRGELDRIGRLRRDGRALHVPRREALRIPDEDDRFLGSNQASDTLPGRFVADRLAGEFELDVVQLDPRIRRDPRKPLDREPHRLGRRRRRARIVFHAEERGRGRGGGEIAGGARDLALRPELERAGHRSVTAM